MIATRQPEAETEEVAPDKSGPRRMLNETQVLALIPVSRTTLHRMTKTGRFPKGTYVSANRRLWFADEIEACQAAMSSTRTVAEAKGVAVCLPTDKTRASRSPGLGLDPCQALLAPRIYIARGPMEDRHE